MSHEDVDLAAIIGPVARIILGEPNKTLSSRNELRFGKRGSLSVRIAGDDRGVWYDHEACEGGGVTDLLRLRGGIVNGGIPAWLKSHGFAETPRPQAQAPRPKIVATYDYRDRAGTLLFQVTRLEPKDFRQRRPNGVGGWIWNLAGVDLVPYRLSELLAADAPEPVFVVEGEKDVEALRGRGLVATTNPGGVKKWRQQYAAHFAGRTVLVLPDNDAAGAEHAEQVRTSLAGVARQVRIMALPGLPPKGDVSDWLATGGTAEQLRAWALEKAPEHQSQPSPPIDWTESLQRDAKGRPIANLANTAHALRSAPELARIISFDQMAQAITLRADIPGNHLPNDAALPRLIRDADLHALQEHLQRRGFPRVGRDIVQQAMELVAVEQSYHPVRQYLAGLTWDRRTRLDTWLSYYLGADPSPYTAAVGRWFLISLIARVMRPGVKVDHLLVLEGPQGARKSTACSIIGSPWFSDALPDLQRGDAVRVSMHLRAKWLIEISELASIGRAEVEVLKAFLTQTEERYLPKYGRHEIIEPRQCVFIATTNEDTYLKDASGGRRFWPIKVGIIDTDALRYDRDQLLAEAFAAFERGEAWWPDPEFEREHIAPQQASRFEQDAWADPVRDFLVGRTKVTLLEVARQALFIEASRLPTSEQRRIARVLTSLGWQRGAKTETGIVWIRGPVRG